MQENEFLDSRGNTVILLATVIMVMAAAIIGVLANVYG